LGAAFYLGDGGFAGIGLDSTETYQPLRVAGDCLQDVVVGLNTQLMGSPAGINNHGDVNSVFIHTGNEFVSGGKLGFRIGVEDSETGVTINILAAVFLYLG